MPLPPFALDEVAVVLRGHFNPAIFSPAWLLAEGLISKTAYAEAELRVISSEIAIFETGWLKCNITRDLLQISTSEESDFERVRDVAVGILRALPQTPVGALGINREMHFLVQSLDQWHRIGDTLAPKEVWESVLKLPGMRGVNIWGVRPDNFAGRIQVDVQPSLRVSLGIYIRHNDHYGLSVVDAQPTTRAKIFPGDEQLEASIEKNPLAVKILIDNFETSMRSSRLVTERIAKLAEG
ncbi:MAG TPA: hypothetical protein VFU43_21175 [Streptosporangiaceae bacterium]|nr:hypothetical protein [Streptosporangiaceae bacterium]